MRQRQQSAIKHSFQSVEHFLRMFHDLPEDMDLICVEVNRDRELVRFIFDDPSAEKICEGGEVLDKVWDFDISYMKKMVEKHG